MARLELAIEISRANMLDVLDRRNEKGYWEGYRDALIEVKQKIKMEMKTNIAN